MSESTNTAKAAILIVNGGQFPQDDRWIRLCLDRIARFTDYPDYHIYLWNNRINDPALDAWLLARPHLNLLSAASYEKLHHPHRTPLQRLYHLARQEGAHYIVALDSDAHPLRTGWLTELLTTLDEGAALAGVWRDMMAPVIRPHVHASCLCTTVEFIERHQLRFDFDNTHAPEKTDTLSHFTWVAEAHGLPIHRLFRSNQRQFHDWIGGVYGDLIYHHVAASRERVVFHHTAKGLLQSDQHRRLRDDAAEILFTAYDSYLAWLQGQPVAASFDEQMRRLQVEAAQKGTLGWWWQRLRSGYVRTDIGARIAARTGLMWAKLPVLPRVARKLRRAINYLRPRQTQSQPKVCRPLVYSFRPENLEPLPSYGWQVRPPDWVGVGAPKSGTSWWYQLLLEHPQIVSHRVRLIGPKNKELQYFLHFQHRNMNAAALDLYCQAFAAPPGAVCGEFSTQYLLYPTLLEQLAAAAPAAKILVILRNPIDRFLSHWNHLTTKRGQRLFGNIRAPQRYGLITISFYTEAMLHSFCGSGMARLLRYFDREQVLVLQFERMVRQPEVELARTYCFLGVDERFRARGYGQPVNQGQYVIPKPDVKERARLAAYLRSDVEHLVSLCPEIDLSLWPDFAPAETKQP